MSTGADHCVYCDEFVAADPANRVGPDFSASAARPPMYAHPGCSHTQRQRTGPLAARKIPRTSR
ncbi:hypothetical protein ABT234_11825 [Streptomyces sp. NPDC001586]|uniref:hypothetical protein n=1 Tax=Streptomyces sp. NPDC001586 TaxID=3154387 RepID=UPI003321F39B